MFKQACRAWASIDKLSYTPLEKRRREQADQEAGEPAVVGQPMSAGTGLRERHACLIEILEIKQMRYTRTDSSKNTVDSTVLRARQNPVAGNKSNFIEFELFGMWAWDHESLPTPDTHWMEFDEMCEQLGLEEAKKATDKFLVELNDALDERSHALEDEIAGTETPMAPANR